MEEGDTSLLNIAHRAGLGAILIVVRDGYQGIWQASTRLRQIPLLPPQSYAPLSTVNRSVMAVVLFKVASKDAVSGSVDPVDGSSERQNVDFYSLSTCEMVT